MHYYFYRSSFFSGRSLCPRFYGVDAPDNVPTKPADAFSDWLNFEQLAGNDGPWCCVRARAALLIYRTSLKSLDLDSLQEIRNGRVIVANNVDLCYADTIDWARLMRESNQSFVRDNRNHADCGNCRFLLHDSLVQKSAVLPSHVVRRIAIKWSLNIPPHLNRSATIPCKIWLSKFKN